MTETKKDLFKLLPALNFLSSKGVAVDLKQFIVSVIAEVVFFFNWKELIENSRDKIAILIKKNCNNEARQYNVLKKYDRESLNLLISYEWDLQDYESCLPKTFADGNWAYEYNANSKQVILTKFIEKKDSYKRSTGKEYPVNDIGRCGEKIYNISGSTTPKVANSHNISNVQIKKVGNFNLVNESKEIKDNLLFIYNDLVEKRGGSEAIKKFEYIWQWKISKDEFLIIKNLLKSERCKKYIWEICVSNVYCLFIVVAYIAESYKREWDGHNQAENELSEIGLRGKSQKLANAYYANCLPKICESGNTTRWLSTIRLEGGLPIYYIISRREYNNSLVDFAKNLYKDSSKSIDSLPNNVKNEAIKHSFNEGYSIGKYIETLLAEGLCGVYSSEDINVEKGIFQEFKSILEHEQKEARRNSKKFAYKYRIWNFQDEFLMHRSLVFKQDTSFNESQELISRERLNQWGVEQLDTNDIFWLKVDGRKYEFHPWGKDYYRSDIGLTEFPLSTVKMPNCSKLEVPIYYIGRDGKEKRIDSIVKQNDKYIKFTSDNGFDWMTGRSGELSAVLLSSKVNFEVEHSEEVLIVGDKLKWVEFFNRIKIDGKYIYSGTLDMRPNDEVIHPIIKCKYVRGVSYTKDDETHEIFLLDSSKVVPKNFNVSVEEKYVTAKTVKYRNTDTNCWEEYQIDSSPCGLVKLDIDGLRLMAYILPSDARINRKCNNKEGQITFTNIDGEIESEECELIQSDNKIRLKDKYTEENKDRDNLIIKIKLTDNEYITLEVIRPFKRSDKVLERHIVSASERIPRKLDLRYQRRIFDENGVSYHDDRSCQYDYSSKRIDFSQNFYYIDKGVSPKIEDNLEFVFISISGEEQQLTLSRKVLEERGREIEYVYFDNLAKENQGVIIQTLEKVVPKLTYYEPKWIGGIGKWEFTQKANPETILRRLKLSIKHKLYLNVLIYCDENRDEITPQTMVKFFADYCDECDKKNQSYNWELLWDIAFELKKDWTYISRSLWKKFVTDTIKKELVCELLLRRPESTSDVFVTYVNNYWSWKWNVKKGGSNQAYKFLKSILGSENIDPDNWEYTGSFPSEDDLNKEMDRLIKKNL